MEFLHRMLARRGPEPGEANNGGVFGDADRWPNLGDIMGRMFPNRKKAVALLRVGLF
jgi:hypothetical protein